MPLILFHFFAGALAGAFFRVQTLLMLALLVLVEAVWRTPASAPLNAVFWGVGAEVTLQFGYLAGVYLRSVLERTDPPFNSATHPAVGSRGSASRPNHD